MEEILKNIEFTEISKYFEEEFRKEIKKGPGYQKTPEKIHSQTEGNIFSVWQDKVDERKR